MHRFEACNVDRTSTERPKGKDEDSENMDDCGLMVVFEMLEPDLRRSCCPGYGGWLAQPFEANPFSEVAKKQPS
jgi:hypothetical protein